MINNWMKFYCPYCDKVNWLDCGDINDLSQPDPEGVICWSCKKHSVFSFDGDLIKLPANLHTCICNSGSEKPN